MRETCFCGRTDRISNREPILDGDGKWALTALVKTIDPKVCACSQNLRREPSASHTNHSPLRPRVYGILVQPL